MRSVFLMTARFALAAWVGAAVLFVVTSIKEQTFDGFPSETKNTLAAIRFPAYYACGFFLVGLTTVTTFATAGEKSPIGRIRRWVVLLLLVACLGVMIADYIVIYQPLEEMMHPDASYTQEEFERMHENSKYINMFHLSLAMAASFLLCWPGPGRK